MSRGTTMSISTKHAEWLVVVLIVAVIGLVFQQAATSMAIQGIASGGPYNNAAAYPKMIAVALALLIGAQGMIQALRARKPTLDSGKQVQVHELLRPGAFVGIFAIYLGSLGFLGYHIATPLMLAALMLLGGIRRPLAILLPISMISFGFAYVFEAWLKIVLPGGILHLNIAW